VSRPLVLFFFQFLHQFPIIQWNWLQLSTYFIHTTEPPNTMGNTISDMLKEAEKKKEADAKQELEMLEKMINAVLDKFQSEITEWAQAVSSSKGSIVDELMPGSSWMQIIQRRPKCLESGAFAKNVSRHIRF